MLILQATPARLHIVKLYIQTPTQTSNKIELEAFTKINSTQEDSLTTSNTVVWLGGRTNHQYLY